MNKAWGKWADKNGYRVAFGEVGLLDVVREFLAKLKSTDKLDKSFYQGWLSGFKYSPGIGIESPTALIVVALPRSAYVIKFEYKGKSGEAVLPPTYFHYRPTFSEVRRQANDALAEEKYRIEPIEAPLKSLAVLTGLGQYGRNNILYVPGLGSYLQLVGFVTDMPLEIKNEKVVLNIEDNLMDTCSNCRACLNACPTGAINEDRILLHAERCYTILSESPGDLPSNILPPSPECIIGCMRCQMVCPVNKGKLYFKEAPFQLSGDDMQFLLENFDKNTPQWEEICKKFQLLGLTEDTSIFIRNLRHLVNIGGGNRKFLGTVL